METTTRAPFCVRDAIESAMMGIIVDAALIVGPTTFDIYQEAHNPTPEGISAALHAPTTLAQVLAALAAELGITPPAGIAAATT